MKEFNPSLLKKLSIPTPDSHKGQNGKVLLIGGSELFHAASLWALEIASKIVDMVFYASVPENNQIVHEAKSAFKNGIVIPREHIDDYIHEADCILIGPGMVRTESRITHHELPIEDIQTINKIPHEGGQTYWLTRYLLHKYPQKKFVIDAGALQMLDPDWLLPLAHRPILTPHPKEFHRVFGIEATPEHVGHMATMYKAVILLKGQTDVICSSHECVVVRGGNAGMTKGGTGDVLAGLTAALYCKNEPFLSATAASFFNKKAGESLFEKVGYYFNSTDLVNEIPKVMKEEILS